MNSAKLRIIWKTIKQTQAAIDTALHEFHVLRCECPSKEMQTKLFNIYWNVLNTDKHQQTSIADNLTMKGIS